MNPKSHWFLNTVTSLIFFTKKLCDHVGRREFFKIWIAVRQKFRKLKFLFYKIMKFKVCKSAYGLFFTSNFDDKTFEYYLTGAYGPFLYTYLSEIDRPHMFLDVGANQGLYTIVAASNDMCVRCFAFEPVPDTYRLLEANIALNKVENKCTCFMKAISDRNGLEQIRVPLNHSGAASLSPQLSAEKYDKIIDIQVIDQLTLSSLLKPEEGVEIVVKVDVEGFEETVLDVLIKSSFGKLVSTIFYEVDENWVQPEKIARFLLENGFPKIQRIGTGTHYDVLATRY